MQTELAGNTLGVYLEEGETFLGHEIVPGTNLSINKFRIDALEIDVTITRPHYAIVIVYTPNDEQVDQKTDGTLIYQHSFHDWRPYPPAPQRNT